MSLCYDFQKWTIVSMASIAISLTGGLVTLAYGQEWNTTQLTQNKTEVDNLTMQIDQLGASKEASVEFSKALEPMVNYCFEHIERPNPIQDLIDKGFASEEYRNITCKDIKMTFDTNQERITELENKINEYWSSPEGQQQRAQELAEFEKEQQQRAQGERRLDAFADCMRIQTNTYEECKRVQAGIK